MAISRKDLNDKLIKYTCCFASKVGCISTKLLLEGVVNSKDILETALMGSLLNDMYSYTTSESSCTNAILTESLEPVLTEDNNCLITES